MSIEVRNLHKAFGSFLALDDISLDVPGGELVALLGPSGSGKTTLLRIIAGLEPADRGTILFHGEDTTGQPVRDRQVGFVFQHYALFRHMSVFENVAFGLRVRPRHVRPSETEIRETVAGLLHLVQLDVLADRRPSELSGGQRQRVALARALAVKPEVLLLDEPFGALDAKVRKELRRWLRRLHEEVHVTSVFVTHDQEEALGPVAHHRRIHHPAGPRVVLGVGEVRRGEVASASGVALVDGVDDLQVVFEDRQALGDGDDAVIADPRRPGLFVCRPEHFERTRQHDHGLVAAQGDQRFVVTPACRRGALKVVDRIDGLGMQLAQLRHDGALAVGPLGAQCRARRLDLPQCASDVGEADLL